jgi:hypothetical protein
VGLNLNSDNGATYRYLFESLKALWQGELIPQRRQVLDPSVIRFTWARP